MWQYVEDYSTYAIPELVRMLGKRSKDYRMRANLTQKEVAEKTGLTVQTIHRFETGTARNISLGTFLRLMQAVGCINFLDEFIPELPPDPYLERPKGKVAQRIRHKKDQS